ncbi:helix-turn-helix domain-containing protein [Acetobacter senegalensis]|uniref:helix-turn-helix domain-containing protein n=1 Tax=Acetobacter senegalensis TaxID=446692 RepID=UPI003451319A
MQMKTFLTWNFHQNKDFCMSLKALLKERGKTQAQLAAQIGVSEPTVSRWVRGSAFIPTQMLRAVSRALGVPLEELVPDDEGVAS